MMCCYGSYRHNSNDSSSKYYYNYYYYNYYCFSSSSSSYYYYYYYYYPSPGRTLDSDCITTPIPNRQSANNNTIYHHG